ncbi:hypothetical protein LTR10_017349 [Elasticomyces elasticus]|uniref:DJ-1/PfpI domain-containing protein n=1 Tax=Exophiala sideris TaxID=1016849 RepID=A0ABR0JAK9_9EURO|nr:hypothetical protein LTR10_017349 [Elasticomyces elasticus]KAK5027894.1 hypothetical protein LTS07_006770 [Exophiala sideris]KAK5037516.1 hypothetical protein LTR13_004673 [Exophiala sideris]KAK5059177.1 hypothetical protein LTR69_006466 [Exophiala sideris]KAK5183011.1 hypothetical protein LTR44_004721 [Eurotiomycetes sp. CCFEE 6388]
MAPKVIFLMADYGHDPTEAAIPWKVFNEAGFDITFATEAGKQPVCDSRMLTGWTGALLGAPQVAKEAYKTFSRDSRVQNPTSWTDPSLKLEDYDLVFLPGGHDKGVRQIIDSPRVHELLAAYFPKTAKPSTKSLVAICHGVQVLATASSAEDKSKSVIHDVQTTALPGFMEQSIYYATWPFLGDYYKTYGAGTDSVQEIVTKRLDSPSLFKNSLGPSPFVVEDPKYNYLSGRFPPDAELLAQKAVAMVNEVTKAA